VLSLGIAIGAVQAFALGRGIARYLERLAVHDVALTMLGKLRLSLYDTLEPLVPGGLRAKRSGGVLSAFVSDCEAVADALAKALGAAIDLVSCATLGVLLAFLLDPLAGTALAAGSALVALVAGGSGRLGRSAAAAQLDVRGELADSVVDAVRSAPELVVYGREDLVTAQLERARACESSAGIKQALATGLGRALVTCFGAATLVAVIALGLVAHDAHRLSGVLLAVLVFDALVVLDAGSGLPGVLAGLAVGDAAASRLGDLAELEPPVPHAEGTSPNGIFRTRRETVCGEHVVARDIDVAAALEDACVVGGDGSLLLDNVTLAVGRSQRLALVGRSGAGKTSAIYALLHFLECSSGRATVGGVDVCSVNRVALAQRISWLPEESHVFAGTLSANLRLADPAATDEECAEVLGNVGLRAWLDSLPGGLATRIGAGGRVLSAGERQRLGMARALLAGGGVLLLDEPTAHLDAASEFRLLSELLDAAGDRAVLITSHDPEIVPHVDEVVTLNVGRVRERATDRRRLTSEGSFARPARRDEGSIGPGLR
jgi:thiol reductant ABC exporter CydC subunit